MFEIQYIHCIWKQLYLEQPCQISHQLGLVDYRFITKSQSHKLSVWGGKGGREREEGEVLLFSLVPESHRVKLNACHWSRNPEQTGFSCFPPDLQNDLTYWFPKIIFPRFTSTRPHTSFHSHLMCLLVFWGCFMYLYFVQLCEVKLCWAWLWHFLYP